MNVTAAAILVGQWTIERWPLPVVVFAAGRPKYLANEDPDLTEGKIMKQYFLESEVVPPDVEIVTQDTNTTTMDDIRQTLFMAKERTLSSVMIVTVLPHIARCMEFLKKLQQNVPALAAIQTTFVSSEMVFAYTHHEQAQTIFELMNSKAYERTMYWERKGISDFRKGAYASAQETPAPR